MPHEPPGTIMGTHQPEVHRSAKGTDTVGFRGIFRQLIMGGDHPVGSHAFFVFWTSGAASVLIDLDHFIPKTWVDMVRPAHLPYLFLVWTVCISYHTYAARRMHKTLLKEKA